jgi:hypothetical protein
LSMVPGGLLYEICSSSLSCSKNCDWPCVVATRRCASETLIAQF